MTEPDLNNPDVRQAILAARLAQGNQLIATALSKEFGISLDTVRRDLIAMEDEGLLKRVRGGAVPVSRPSQPLHIRMHQVNPNNSVIARAVFSHISDGMVLLLDGGTSVLELGRLLPAGFSGVVVTPAPAIATGALERDIDTILIGGRLSRLGGIAVGAETERSISECAADLCVLGACGIEPSFGLSADDIDEAGVKRQMAWASARTIVMAGSEKLDQRSRYRVMPCSAVDLLVTDADKASTAAFQEADMEVEHV
ncbi:MAG: DeoR/GlpR family DNA-binding transcription regulator [Geminicoccaceae bacterium]